MYNENGHTSNRCKNVTENKITNSQHNHLNHPNPISGKYDLENHTHHFYIEN